MGDEVHDLEQPCSASQPEVGLAAGSWMEGWMAVNGACVCARSSGRLHNSKMAKSELVERR